jgi:hypothetical protein
MQSVIDYLFFSLEILASVERRAGGGQLVYESRGGNLITSIPKCERPFGWWPVVMPAGIKDPVAFLESHPMNATQASASNPSSRKLLQLPPDYDGWLAYTELMDAAGYTQFLGYFSVPQPPKSIPDILYIFTGVQNIDWIPKTDPEPTGPFDIVQPVLQSPADSGDSWSVKSWLVTLDEGAIQSPEIVVQPGQKIFGNMTLVAPSTWYCGSYIGSPQGQVTSFTQTDTSRLGVQPWAYTTLECYGCGSCDSYPVDACEFTEMQIFKNGHPVLPLPWNITPKKPLATFCNETVRIVSIDGKIVDGSAATYYFQYSH